MKTLKHKLIVFFIVALLILGSLTAVTLVITRQEQANNRLSEQSVEHLLLLDSVVTTLFEAESSQRAYAATGSGIFLVEHQVQRDHLARGIAELESVAKAHSETSLARDFVGLVRQRLAMMDELILTVEAQGSDAAIDQIALGTGKRLMDQIRNSASALLGFEQDQITARSMITERHLQQLLVMVPLASGVSIVLFIIAIVFTLAAMRRNQRLLDELDSTGRDIRVINELSSSLQSSESREDAAAILSHYLTRLFPASAGGLYLMRSSRNHLELVATWGEPGSAMAVSMAPSDCWALRLGRTYQRSGDSDLRCHHLTLDDHSTLCVPLTAQGDIVGMIHIESSTLETLEKIKPLAEFTGTHIGAALAGISLRESLRQQNIRDPLTGLFNRRYLEETLDRELHRARRGNTRLSLIMLDIDHFKQFNDHHGHQAGDLLLKEFGNNLRAHVRGQDIACRYGGEEFMLVMPEASLENAVKRAETLRQSLVSLVVDYQGARLPSITASFGVAAYPQDGDDAETLQRLADRALYHAKASGRDQVAVVADL